MGCSDCDDSSYGDAVVDDCEFVVAGGQPAPLFDGVDAAFDDVAVLVICRIESWRPLTAVGAALLVRRCFVMTPRRWRTLGRGLPDIRGNLTQSIWPTKKGA